MTHRSRVVLLVVGALLALVVGLALATGSDEAGEQSDEADEEPAATASPEPSPVLEDSHDDQGDEADQEDAEPPPDPHGGDNQPLVTDDEVWADIADPANSDLPPDQFQQAADVAAAVVRADTTGQGRERWPHYWQDRRAQPCCADVTIHAAGARHHPDHADEVEATVVWSGDPHPHVSGTFTEQITHLRLAPANDTWRPRR